MPDIEVSSHAWEMLAERNIEIEWLWRTLKYPDNQQVGEDDNMHYSKAIDENDGRVLHVVVNSRGQPERVVTVFFDRRLRKKK